MNKHLKISTSVIVIAVFGLLTVIFIACAGIFYVKYSGGSDETSESESSVQNVQEEEKVDLYVLYPKLEDLIGKTLDEVEGVYPEGRVINSKTTSGEVWKSYEYENSLFILLVDGKKSGIVDYASIAVKSLTGCVLDESVLDEVKNVLPYAGIDFEKIGTANNPGIYQGLVSYYDYKDGYVVSVTCHLTLQGDSYYQVAYFKNLYE
ncbi:MAG: hypothetical protein ABIE03_05040 [Patescibacteria group bacterium]|nr:hypothetical protein [Patescibacteria group bacterium]